MVQLVPAWTSWMLLIPRASADWVAASVAAPDPALRRLQLGEAAAAAAPAGVSPPVALPATPTLAPWWIPETKVSGEQRTCLKPHAPGCNHITSMGQCLSSSDGREAELMYGLKIQGEPCVWCGGVRCTSESASLCEPYDYVMRGEGTAFRVFNAKSTFKVATCAKRAAAVLDDGVGCLGHAESGCPALKDAASCLSHRDGRPHALMDGLRVRGEPCMWCGGVPCHSNNGNLCEPFDWARNGEGRAFATFHAWNNYWIAGCKNGRSAARTEKTFPKRIDGYTPIVGHPPELVPAWVPTKPGADELRCLRPASGGCSRLGDRASCMTSREGGEAPKVEPCVWCGGVACTSNSTSVCEPFDFVMYGEGKDFSSFMARHSFKVAGCSKGHTAPPNLDYGCLNPSSPEGCRGIRDAYACLTSRDGSAVTRIGALSVQGQPCVWCGGGPCHSSNQSVLCEAFDYAVNGEGSVFESFLARGAYRLGSCKDGLPQPATATNFSSFVQGFTSGAAPTVKPLSWVPERPKGAELDCLKEETSGCWAIEHRVVCLGSKDGQPVKEVSGLKVHGEPCVWCAGGHCRSGSGNLCEPFDFLMHGEGKAFDTFEAKGSFSVARCKAGKPLIPVTDVPPAPSLAAPPARKTPEWERWWIPTRPAEANMTCLREQSAGCSAIRNMGACLSSRDGRTEQRADGLRIHGEPCVWCNGGRCHSNGTTYCEPFDYLMRGQGKAFGTFYAIGSKTVASCKAGPSAALPSFVDVSCLGGNNSGCSSFKDAASCLASKDGRPEATMDGLRVHGQPCVWCGGGVCHSTNGNMCEPFDWVMNGERKSFSLFSARHDFRFAGCKDGRPAAMTTQGFAEVVPGYVEPVAGPPPLVPHWVPRRPTEDSILCLNEFAGGCEAIKEEKFCLSSRDGRSTPALQGLKIRGEACVWCGAACTSKSASSCQPFDYVMHGQGVAFKAFYAKQTFKVAGCQAEFAPPDNDYSCLRVALSGCHSLTSGLECMSSRDGRTSQRLDDRNLRVDPCVWCGGGICHSTASNLCEPFSDVMKGQGHALQNFHPFLNYLIAACHEGEPQGVVLDGLQTSAPEAAPRVEGVLEKPEETELDCLREHRYGCFAIQDRSTCLGSKDGRAQKELFGLKVHGEPCVWCGGGHCQGGSRNLCESFDFLVHGVGRPSDTLEARDFSVARCRAGKPVIPASDPQLLPPVASPESAGLAPGAQADCWYECGERAGFCDWCGAGKACCGKGFDGNPAECLSAPALTLATHHQCVPVMTALGPEEVPTQGSGRVKLAPAAAPTHEGEGGVLGPAQAPLPEYSTEAAGVLHPGVAPGTNGSAAAAPKAAGSEPALPEGTAAVPLEPSTTQAAVPVHLGQSTTQDGIFVDRNGASATAVTNTEAQHGISTEVRVPCALILLCCFALLLYLCGCCGRKRLRKSVLRHGMEKNSPAANMYSIVSGSGDKMQIPLVNSPDPSTARSDKDQGSPAASRSLRLAAWLNQHGSAPEPTNAVAAPSPTARPMQLMMQRPVGQPSFVRIP